MCVQTRDEVHACVHVAVCHYTVMADVVAHVKCVIAALLPCVCCVRFSGWEWVAVVAAVEVIRTRTSTARTATTTTAGMHT